MLWNRSETSWLRSANLSAQHSAGHIPVIWFTSRPKKKHQKPRPVPNWRKSHLGNFRLHDHAYSCSLVPRWDRLSSSWITQKHVDQHFLTVQTDSSWLLILQVRHEQFLRPSTARTVPITLRRSRSATLVEIKKMQCAKNHAAWCKNHTAPAQKNTAALDVSTKPTIYNCLWMTHVTLLYSRHANKTTAQKLGTI